MPLLELTSSEASRIGRIVKQIPFSIDNSQEQLLTNPTYRHGLAIRNCPDTDVYGFRFANIRQRDIHDHIEGRNVTEARGHVVYYAKR